ncbi:MAG: hypothetical protein OCU16_05620, partial [Candidatus Methanospirare jalkutatii]|nr:hypothetical protein [Candidatus Methanospirare jalkutatii]
MRQRQYGTKLKNKKGVVEKVYSLFFLTVVLILTAAITESKPTSAVSPIGVIVGTGAGGAGIAYKYCVTLTVSPGDNSIAVVSLFPQRYVIALSLPGPAMIRPAGVKSNAKSYTPGDGMLPQAANCKRS